MMEICVSITTGLCTLVYGSLLLGTPHKRGVSYKDLLSAHIRRSSLGQTIEILQAAASVVACVMFVVETYFGENEVPEWTFELEVALTLFFTFHYVIYLYLSENMFHYILFDFQAVVDAVTITPVFMRLLMGKELIEGFGFLRVLRFFRVLRLLRIFRSLDFMSEIAGGLVVDSAIFRQSMVLMSTIVSFLVCCAGFVQWMAKDNEQEWGLPPGDEMHFHDSLYFIVVLFSSVGFGDISPHEYWGRLVCIVMIIVALAIVPMETQKLVDLFALQPKYGGIYVRNRRQNHIVLVSDANCSGVYSFLQEFFHEDHGKCDTHIVVLCPSAEPHENIKSLLLQKGGKGRHSRLTFLSGDAIVQTDLFRARIDIADACFILINKFAANTNGEDSRAVLRAMSVKIFEKNLRVFVQIIEPENRRHLIAAGVDPDDIMCVNELKYNLMGSNCICMGYATIIANLTSSAMLNSEEDMVGSMWLQEYSHGMTQEVYAAPVPIFMVGKTMAAAAWMIYNRMEACLLAVGCWDASISKHDVKLTMGDHTLAEHDVMYIISESSTIVAELFEWESEVIALNPKSMRNIIGRRSLRRIRNSVVRSIKSTSSGRSKAPPARPDRPGARPDRPTAPATGPSLRRQQSSRLKPPDWMMRNVEWAKQTVGKLGLLSKETNSENGDDKHLTRQPSRPRSGTPSTATTIYRSVAARVHTWMVKLHLSSDKVVPEEEGEGAVDVWALPPNPYGRPRHSARISEDGITRITPSPPPRSSQCSPQLTQMADPSQQQGRLSRSATVGEGVQYGVESSNGHETDAAPAGDPQRHAMRDPKPLRPTTTPRSLTYGSLAEALGAVGREEGSSESEILARVERAAEVEREAREATSMAVGTLADTDRSRGGGGSSRIMQKASDGSAGAEDAALYIQPSTFGDEEMPQDFANRTAVQEMEFFLNTHGLGAYSAGLEALGFDMVSLVSVTEEQLKETAVLLGHRKALLAALGQYRKHMAGSGTIDDPGTEAHLFAVHQARLADSLKAHIHVHTKVQGHILIMAETLDDMFYLVGPMRVHSAIEGGNRPIVFLLSAYPELRHWEEIHFFKDVQIILGDLHNKRDLLRANALEAYMCLLLTPAGGEDMIEVDARVILAALGMRSLVARASRPLHMVTELYHTSMARHLRPAAPLDTWNDYHTGFLMEPAFASGQVVSSSWLETLMSQAYFNPEIIKVVKKMVSLVEMYSHDHRSLNKPSAGHFERMKSAVRPVLLDVFNTDHCGVLPHDARYEDLVCSLCMEKNLIPIALLRPPECYTNALPYMINNPRRYVPLVEGDQVIVYDSLFIHHSQEEVTRGPEDTVEESRI